MTATPVTTMTVEDYLALDTERYRRAELVNGMLIEVNPPHGRHQLMAANLLVALRAAAPAGHSVLQEWGWVTHPGRSVREPDLMVVPSELVDAPVLTQPPLLAVEVLSPDSGLRDLLDKRAEYAAAGLGRYLVAAPDTSPALLYYESQGGALVERAFVAGRNALTLPEPFNPAAALVPMDLVRLG